ncbi:MAG TPA: membrane dipeptidase [Candidatus Sabulitectum sp.]|nr:membrane dipeptidase [Candidatus Sabulitectum sp.]HPJ28624.1 membrane dipeptidase [Candidatus Sabulitectum sp.]HPR23293.1 membrane dipeptidase [Candidatus Sabulitectum sp.]
MSSPINVGIFDAHCDTLVKEGTGDLFQEGNPSAHVDGPRLAEGGVTHQVMAVCTEPYKGREKEIWDIGVETFLKIREYHPTRLFFAIEGCLPLWEGWRVPERPLVASLTWNGDNPYAGGIGSEMGLTGPGRELAMKFAEDGTAIDVSHLNDRSRASLIRTGLPLCATHCNARKLCEGKGRNLPDQDIKAIADSGGVTGVTFVPDFLEEKGEEATIESVVNHIEYIAELTSTDSVGFGSDFDGITALPGGITGADSWPAVIEALRGRGWSTEDVNKVAGSNWRRFFGIGVENTRRSN